jgi:hypothetical protein
VTEGVKINHYRLYGKNNQVFWEYTFKSELLSIKLFPKSRFNILTFLAKSEGIVYSEFKQDVSHLRTSNMNQCARRMQNGIIK